jgi:MFS family permease
MQSPVASPVESSKSFYTNQFWLLCASVALFSASFQMLLPELPSFLTSLGGASYKGYILFLFTLTAGISRPFSGKLTDTIGRVPVMVVGSLVCMVCSLCYPLVGTIGAFMFLRLLHGFSTGFKPTATSAYVADIVSEDRRGEAMSVMGISGSLGMSIGPALGGWIGSSFGLNTLFFTSSGLALLSVLILLGGLKETLKNPVRFHPRLLKISRDEILDRKALPPAFVMFLVSFASGTVLAMIPDMSQNMGIKNKGLYFTVYTFASLLIRLVAGKSSDTYGRVPVLFYSCLAIIVGLLMTAVAPNFWVFMLAACIYGCSWGMNSPTISAWTVDLVSSENKGKGLATMFIGLEAGIGLGAFVSQLIYDNRVERMAYPFYLSALLAVVAAIYLRKKEING